MKKLQRKSAGKLILRFHDTVIILCSYTLGFRPSEPQAHSFRQAAEFRILESEDFRGKNTTYKL